MLLGGFLSIGTPDFTRLWTGIVRLGARSSRRYVKLQANELSELPAAPNHPYHGHTL
jgi:hypothetical protein